MKYKRYFKKISHNSRLYSIMHKKAVLVLLVFLLMLIECGCVKSSEISNSDHSVMDDQADMIQMETEFNSLISQYNSIVEDYNSKAAHINGLLDKLGEFSIDNLPNHITEQCKYSQGFAQYKKTEKDCSKLNTEVKQLADLTTNLKNEYDDICQFAYDSAISDYNILAKAYNELVKETAITYISNLRSTVILKNRSSVVITKEYSEDDLIKDIQSIIEDINNLAADYSVVSQINTPTEQWVIMRLNAVKGIKGKQAVTAENDPNGLLGKKGGYISCVYFTVNNIDSDSVPGDDIVAKGTDAGGAIEVYPTLEAAKNRCDYLSQYDNTLLYSGSYVIVGTMVIRTSYKLNNQEQIDLTNSIIESFTRLND